ncbi:glycosyltransferase family 4 protein [Maridesulfovibrio sp.]|uniref:glycosyltransferase family 4 protein n=1 Tax=Maridesulfovibrio sp. TaxID=2795000 RepID=UPI0029CA45E6|nr:glycosyltransferase family 4 protein [Maridesulfovibrio sp.]
MKILHLLGQIPDATGSGKYVQEMIKQSLHGGHTPYLVAGVPKGFTLKDTSLDGVIAPENCLFIYFEERELGFKVVGMSDVMPYPSTVCAHLTPDDITAYLSVFEKCIKKAITHFSPDLIHSNHLWMATAAARRAAPDIPLVTTCHGTCLRQHHLCPALGQSLYEALSGIDKIIALFEQQKFEIKKLLNVPGEKVVTISGGFNQGCFFREEEKSKADKNTIHLLYAGKLTRAKGVPWLLHCLTDLKDMPFHLHLVGGGHGLEKEECLHLAAKLGTKVTVHGILPHQQLGQLMRNSDIFVLPSFYEGLPLVLLEALACGCRIITTDLPGVQELFSINPADTIHMVKLPPLQTIDAPRTEDMPMLNKQLQSALRDAIFAVQSGKQPDVKLITQLTEQYTWNNIFKRIESVYRQSFSS